MAGGTEEAPKRTFGCALATRSKRSGVSALKLRSGYWTETVNPLNRLGQHRLLMCGKCPWRSNVDHVSQHLFHKNL